MADCSYARCVQERRFIKRELQKWNKDMVHIVGKYFGCHFGCFLDSKRKIKAQNHLQVIMSDEKISAVFVNVYVPIRFK